MILKKRFGVIRVWSIVALLLISSPLNGCLSQDDNSAWPDPISWDCSIEMRFDLYCSSYLEGFDSPIISSKTPDGSQLWIVENSGRIRSWDGSSIREVADLSPLVSRCHIEQGLLGFVFEEDFVDSKIVLVSYVEEGTCEGPNESDLILASLLVRDDGTLDLSTLRILKQIEQPYRNHNGGHLLGIGENRYLLGVGDGGSSFDPGNNGQNSSTLLGSMLLFSFQDGEISPIIDSSIGDPYVLHYGLRNPWRFDVDNQERLWIADVGQNCWEEVNLVSLDVQANLGWSEMEGNSQLNKDSCEIKTPDESEIENMTAPIVTYSHEGNCSITGGFWMEWGPEKLRDGYLYGDFCSGSIWIIREDSGIWYDEYVGDSGVMIVGFGRGLNDELLVFGWMGGIIQFV